MRKDNIVRFQSKFHSYEDVGLIIRDRTGELFIIGVKDPDVKLHITNTLMIEVIGNLIDNPDLLPPSDSDYWNWVRLHERTVEPDHVEVIHTLKKFLVQLSKLPVEEFPLLIERLKNLLEGKDED